MKTNGLTFRLIAAEGGGGNGGVDAAQVWRVLRGKSNPTYETLKRVSKGMGVTMEELVRWLGIEWKRV